MPLHDPALLRAFVAVIEYGGFTRAARALYLTQSTVSQQVRRLEQAAGHLLLDRSGPQPVTTEAGERLLGYARRLLVLGEEARAAMGRVAQQEVIRLGVPEDLGGRALTPVLSNFARRMGNSVRLEVTSGMTGERSSNPVSSDRSPVRVLRDQSSIFASTRTMCPPWTDMSWRASAMRCKHK